MVPRCIRLVAISILSLNLVVALDCLGVRGRSVGAACGASGRGAGAVVVGSAIVLRAGCGLTIVLGLATIGIWSALGARLLANEDVGDATRLVVLGHLLVVVVRVRELCDDVPGVEETWKPAEAREEDVDEGVNGADAALDPDGQRREEDGEEAEEDVCVAHAGRVLRCSSSSIVLGE